MRVAITRNIIASTLLHIKFSQCIQLYPEIISISNFHGNFQMAEFFVDFFFFVFALLQIRVVRDIQLKWAMATSRTDSKVSHMPMFDWISEAPACVIEFRHLNFLLSRNNFSEFDYFVKRDASHRTHQKLTIETQQSIFSLLFRGFHIIKCRIIYKFFKQVESMMNIWTGEFPAEFP